MIKTEKNTTEESLYKGVAFNAPFRDYQSRILNAMPLFLGDKKLHISAAPGAGKTILGLEVIRRLNKKALVLVPTINLRNQWKDRFIDSFLYEGSKDFDFSTKLDEPGIITCSTYQALYHLYDKEDKDGKGFEELISEYHRQGVGVVCLDEAHHLKREWWNALTAFLAKLDVYLISLTATPPQDSTDPEWKRYIDLCGDIDMEVSIPEMVVKNALCPHQDYIYICKPTKDEEDKIRKEIEENRSCQMTVLRDAELYREIRDQKLFGNPYSCSDIILKNPDYLSHLFGYMAFIREKWQVEFEESRLKAQDVFKSWDKNVRKLFDEFAQKSHEVDDWFLPLMRDILEYAPQDYSENVRNRIIKELTLNHLFVKGKVSDRERLEHIDKNLGKSVRKLEGIVDIVTKESVSMGNDLRCLILMDHIKKENMTKVETDESLTDFGVATVFERLRRQEHLGNLEKFFEIDTPENRAADRTYRVRLGVLTGSLVILPEDLMNEMLESEGLGISPKRLGVTGYSSIEAGDSYSDKITGIVTGFFNVGRIEILIGTAALLGEGWDAPAVNTLIIGSTSATFVKSNQMRGRALRLDKTQPDKVSNIWHLITMSDNVKDSNELKSMEKRFDSIIGLSMDGRQVINGIDRITESGYSMKDENGWNSHMFDRSKDRDFVRKSWNKVQMNFKSSIVRDVLELKDSVTCVRLKDRIGRGALGLRELNKIAAAIPDALKKCGFIDGACKLKIDESNGYIRYYLLTDTVRDGALFAKCMREASEPVGYPRYLIKKGIFIKKYIPVPAILGSKKEYAETFCKCLGSGQLLAVISDEGKEALLKCRLRQRTASPDSIKMVKELI